MVFDANWRAIFGLGRRVGEVDVMALDDAGTAFETWEYGCGTQSDWKPGSSWAEPGLRMKAKARLNFDLVDSRSE